MFFSIFTGLCNHLTLDHFSLPKRNPEPPAVTFLPCFHPQPHTKTNPLSLQIFLFWTLCMSGTAQYRVSYD